MQSQLAAAHSYSDLAGLNALRTLGRENSSAALTEVAKQFESIFIGQMLKSMRSANEVFSRDGLFSGWEMGFRQQMFDSQVSLSLAQGKGLGLSTFFEREMKRRLLPDEGESNVDEPAASEAALRRTDKVPRMPVRTAASATHAVASAGRGKVRFDSPEQFIETIAPLARRAAERLGVDSRVLMAQSALETGWGQAITGDRLGSSHNLFNIKAGSDWSGPTVSVATIEYRDGLAVREQHRFRAYRSFAASFDDYVQLISGRARYQVALASAGEPEQFLRELQDAGYATDPEYANKVLGIIDRPGLDAQGP